MSRKQRKGVRVKFSGMNEEQMSTGKNKTMCRIRTCHRKLICFLRQKKMTLRGNPAFFLITKHSFLQIIWFNLSTAATLKQTLHIRFKKNKQQQKFHYVHSFHDNIQLRTNKILVEIQTIIRIHVSCEWKMNIPTASCPLILSTLQ